MRIGSCLLILNYNQYNDLVYRLLCNWIHKLTFFPNNLHLQIKDGLMGDFFRAYSEKRFVENFGGVKDEILGGYRNPEGSFDRPLRIIPRKPNILKKAGIPTNPNMALLTN